jgi:hypothetical protein
MTTYVVTDRAVKVSLGSPDGNSIVRFLRKGDVVPERVDKKVLARLLDRGMITAFDEPEQPAAGTD